MKKSLWMFMLCGLVLGAAGVAAQTPDGVPPSRETVCDLERGAAYGLCTAYCEAMDCGDPNQKASDKACEQVRRNFEKKTGRPIPCAVTCPCPGLLAAFKRITNNEVTVAQCIDYPERLFVVTDQGEQIIVENGPPANCNVNNAPPFIALTPTESQVCRVTLRRAVEAQGITCNPPEFTGE